MRATRKKLSARLSYSDGSAVPAGRHPMQGGGSRRLGVGEGDVAGEGGAAKKRFLCGAGVAATIALCACGSTGGGASRDFPLQEVSPGDGLAVELQYKNDSNITGKALYPPGFRAYATRDTAEALREAAREMMSRGYELVLLDAWRPPVASALLWNEAVRKGLRSMYAPPGISGHTRGTAVDVTLRAVDGSPVWMPGDYDCHISGREDTFHSRLLGEAMRRAGFAGHRGEWWHFDHPSGREAAIVDNPWEKRGRRVVLDSPGD